MTAVVSTRCRRCNAELTDRFSRTLGYGPECRKSMTPDQLADAIRANQPGYVPRAQPPRPASATARRNHAEIERVTAPVVAAKRCVHDGIPGACPLCRRDNDPWRAAERIIALIKAEREEQRARAHAEWLAANQPEPEQLTIGAAP